MGIGNAKYLFPESNSSRTMEFTPVSEFQFHEPWEDETDITIGLCFNNVYIPEEILVNILSYVPPEHLLPLSLVCKKWCNIIKSSEPWKTIYNRQYPIATKKLPWYVYYNFFNTTNFSNLIRNGNGQHQFNHWRIVKNYGDQFKIENVPAGCDPLALDVPEFNGHSCCFATSFHACNKIQAVSLKDKRLLRYILHKFKPHIYVSEWITGRFDCGCTYRLSVSGWSQVYTLDMIFKSYNDEEGPRGQPLFSLNKDVVIHQWQGGTWQKIDILIDDYPSDLATLIFEHEGQDTQFWKGHYGSKMAGGVLRFDFNSIQPIEDMEGLLIDNSL